MKKTNKKGFTLMEMLIVVAIIAILVAISIPVFTSQLDKAKKATDDANIRAAKACAVLAFIDGKYTTITTAGSSETDLKFDTTDPVVVNYDAENGCLTTATPNAYTKYNDDSGDFKYIAESYLTVSISSDGAVVIAVNE